MLLTSSLLSALALEAVLRQLEPPQRENARPQYYFEQRSAEFGWHNKSDAAGHYAAGHCYGQVTIDEFSNRRNAVDQTFRPEDETILFIGDSTTVALEVDDNQTIPALLEQDLRRNGRAVSVVNLGVRGYGTDQAVRKALLQARRLRPRQIIYMYTDNDFYENNVVRPLPGDRSKGVFLRDEEGAFEPYNYPVRDLPPDEYAAVLLDRAGRPFHYAGPLPASPFDEPPPRPRGRVESFLERVRVYKALVELKRSLFPTSAIEIKWRRWRDRQADPYEVMNDSSSDAYDVYITLFLGLIDGGSLRTLHREYYESQFAFLLNLLRDIPGLERVHLVEFVSQATLDLMESGRPSANRRLFEALQDRGLIDSYINLNEILRGDGVSYRSLTCGGDDHFNADGNRWAATAILERCASAGLDSVSDPERQDAQHQKLTSKQRSGQPAPASAPQPSAATTSDPSSGVPRSSDATRSDPPFRKCQPPGRTTQKPFRCPQPSPRTDVRRSCRRDNADRIPSENKGWLE